MLGLLVDQGTALGKNKLAANILNIALKAAIDNILAGGNGNILSGAGRQAGQQSAIAAREKGGGVSGGEQLVRMNEKGEEFVLDAQTTAAYGLSGTSSMNDFKRAAETAKVNNQIAQGKSLAIALAPQPASVPEPINYELLGKEVGKNMPKHDFQAVGDHLVQYTEKYRNIEKVVYKNKSKSYRPKQIQNGVW